MSAQTPTAERVSTSWMVSSGKLKMGPGLHTALVAVLDEPYRAMLAAARFNNVKMVVDSRSNSAALMDYLTVELPRLIDVLLTVDPRQARPAAGLLMALTGEAVEREERKVSIDLTAGADEGWPEVRGLTKSDLRDPMTLLDILRGIAKADGMGWSDFIGEWGGVDRTAREYGLPWAEWMTDAFETELASIAATS